jgi:hypothetical protein
VKSTVITCGASATRKATIGKMMSASRRVVSCQSASASPTRRSMPSRAIATIITLALDVVSTSTSGICRQPTA